MCSSQTTSTPNRLQIHVLTLGTFVNNNYFAIGAILRVLFIGLVLITLEKPGSRDGASAGKRRLRYPGSYLPTDASSTRSYEGVCVSVCVPLPLFSSPLFTSSAAKCRFLFPALLVAPYTRRLVFLSPQIILGIFDLFLLLLIIHNVFLDIGDNHVL